MTILQSEDLYEKLIQELLKIEIMQYYIDLNYGGETNGNNN